MKRTWFSGLSYVGWLALLASGCAGKEISVGGEAGEGLDRCVGASDQCLANAKARPAEETDPGACSDEVVGQLEVDYVFNVTERLCPRPSGGCGTNADGSARLLCPINIADSCSVRLQAGRPAPDGSLWLAASVMGIGTEGESKESLWLGHVGNDGSDQGFFKLAQGTQLRGNAVYYAADLAVDGDGHAHVIVNGNDPGPDADSEIRDHTWLAHYDRAGKPADAAWDLPGLARAFLALTAQGRVAVAGNAVNLERRAIAALLDSDSTLVWSQPKIPSTGARALGILGLGVDLEENVFVYTQRKERGSAADFGVMMFDASGRRMWDRTLSGTFQGSIAYEGTFGVDDDGNVAISGYLPDNGDGPPPLDGPSRIVSLDKRGNTRWTLDVPEASPGFRVSASTGDIYAGGGKSVVRISRDGACARIAWPTDGNGRGGIEPGQDGELYFVSSWTVGRYKPLASH